MSYRIPCRGVTILHGGNDDVIPVSMSQSLKNIFNDRVTLEVISGSNHQVLNDVSLRVAALMQ